MLGSMLIRVDRQTKPGVVSFAVVKDLVLHTMQGFPVEYQFEQKKKYFGLLGKINTSYFD